MNTMRSTGVEYFGTSTQFSQVLSHLQIASPANGDPICQACGEAIVESDPVTPYFSRPAGHSNYIVDQYCCSDDDDKDLISRFTLGTREMVVDGRIGQYRDQAIQQTWLVFLNPSTRLISEADTKSGRRINDHPDGHSHTDHPARNRTSTEAIQEQANCTALYDSPNPITVQSIGGRQ